MNSESKLPTKEEIAELPRWTIVALAARCARRVLPLFQGEGRDDVLRAVKGAEQYAGAASGDANAGRGQCIWRVMPAESMRLFLTRIWSPLDTCYKNSNRESWTQNSRSSKSMPRTGAT